MAENTYNMTSSGEYQTRKSAAETGSGPELHERIPFTGIVVNYNEAGHLRDCLKSLAFCDELIVVDLGSTDASVEIAKACGARVIPHERVPIVEQIWAKAVGYAKTDWIVLVDPDEVLPDRMEDDLRSTIMSDPGLGVVSVPLQYYFRGKPLNHSFWGSEQNKRLALHRRRTRFNPSVHRGTEILGEYKISKLPRKPHKYIKHYWADSYRQLFEKHWRYIKKEGESRYNTGERFSWLLLFRETAGSLKYSLVNCRGLRGGISGVLLSLFYAWYMGISLLSLCRYQRLAQLKKP